MSNVQKQDQVETHVAAKPYDVVEHVKVLASLYTGIKPEEMVACLDDESGSNCSKSVLLGRDQKELELFRKIVDQTSGNFFGTGVSCRMRSKLWREIKAEYNLPEEFTWETAVAVAYMKFYIELNCLRHPESLVMAAWCSVLATPDLVFSHAR